MTPQPQENITYRVTFNSFGSCFVIAKNFAEAEKCFLESGYGGKDVFIKSIAVEGETNPPIISSL